LYSISFKTIFALVTIISKFLSNLFIVNFTFVQAGHLIHDTTSFKEFSFNTSLSSTFVIISHHFNHAFCDGDQDIGDTILTNHGFSIST
jgi:hypothetical protein